MNYSEMNVGLIGGDICNRNGCDGVITEVDNGTSCSCHINPPCSHCTDMEFECDTCGFLVEKPESKPIYYKPIPEKYARKSDDELFNELKDGVYGYVLIPGKYYWMEAKGKYPEGMTKDEILAKFNTCFGYQWILEPKNGQFHLKYYTD